MGRAKGVNDAFSLVVGERRGREPEETIDGQYVRGEAFMRDTHDYTDHKRRVTIVEMMLKGAEETGGFPEHTPDHFSAHSGLYREGSIVDNVAACRQDLEYLTEHGILVREVREERFRGVEPIYKLRPFDSWPREAQQDYPL